MAGAEVAREAGELTYGKVYDGRKLDTANHILYCTDN